MEQRIYTLTPLTGVHIGTGEELTLLDYKIASKIENNDSKKPTYLKFSNDRILKRLISEKNQKALSAFERASVKGNMEELQIFFHENCAKIKDLDYSGVITKGFLKTYNANLDKDPFQNAAKVLQMYHTSGTPNPVIPGSSIKGSIRTALLNKYLGDLPERDKENLHKLLEDEQKFNQYKKKNYYKEEKQIQQKLFENNDGKDDPLRAVLFPDCSFMSTGTQLVGGLKIVFFDEQTEALEPIGTQIQAEVIRGVLLNGKASSELCISINDKLQKVPFSVHKDERQKCIKQITFEDIQKSCNEFYWSVFEDEYDYFYKGVNDGTVELIVKLKNKLEEALKAKGTFIIRVGRWSQFESITFEKNFRRLEIKRDKKGKLIKPGTMRTLFDYDGKYVPMGWCILSEQGQ
jgi:CRISPR-associated protein Csm5